MNEHRVRSNHAGWLTRERALILVLLAATALAFLLCYLLVQPFIPVIAWALALAIVARPLHDAIARRIRHPNVAAAAAVILVAVWIVVPVLFVMHCLIEEATAGAEQLRAKTEDGEWLANAEATPWIGAAFQWFRANIDLHAALQEAAAFVSRIVSQAVASSIWAAVQLMFVLFTLFFFFRDRGVVLRSVRSLLPLSDGETDEVLRRVNETIHATVYGSLVVALIQGAMGGLMFWWLGLPSPLTWGVVMALLAVVPNLGAFIVWAPAAAFLALNGEMGRALILTLWGAIAIGLIDNLLYPYLVGQRMRLHTLLAFFAILGGLLLLGVSGVVLGPVIVAVTIALVDVWRRRTTGGKPAETGVRSESPGSTLSNNKKRRRRGQLAD